MSTEKPRIAIPVPTSRGVSYNLRSWRQYAEAVLGAGGTPVEVALGLGPAELRSRMESCDGICLPGSPADVDPQRYGAELNPSTAPADLQREDTDFRLLDMASTAGTPVLGICYGLQSMTVWSGGSLIQDLLAVPVNHSAGASVAVAHSTMVAPGSELADLLDTQETQRAGEFLRLSINSSHHQAVSIPGEGFRVVARCPEDGVIEAVEIDSAPLSAGSRAGWMLGVQWHPERSTGISRSSQALFRRFVQQACRRQTERADSARVPVEA